MTPIPGTITAVLSRVRTDGPAAWDALLPLVYNDLHSLAEAYIRKHAHNGVLQPTALVNETYLRLLRQKVFEWKNRAHFFGVTALLMRRILVDEARRTGNSVRVLEAVGNQKPPVQNHSIGLGELDSALTQLAQLDPRQAQVVELRYFGGLTIDETAEFLGVSPKTVKRDWEVARAWLRAELRGRDA
jgi:RNA polymerase sigma factor (TIGR02999 family)